MLFKDIKDGDTLWCLNRKTVDVYKVLLKELGL